MAAVAVVLMAALAAHTSGGPGGSVGDTNANGGTTGSATRRQALWERW